MILGRHRWGVVVLGSKHDNVPSLIKISQKSQPEASTQIYIHTSDGRTNRQTDRRTNRRRLIEQMILNRLV